jgi:hypothetical protein
MRDCKRVKISSGGAREHTSRLPPGSFVFPILLRFASCAFLTFLLVTVFSSATLSGPLEFEETDTLPYVENILFSASTVGIVSKDGRYFLIDRKTENVHQVDEVAVLHALPRPWPPKPWEDRQGKEILRSSNGQEFQQTPSYCGEGETIGHALQCDSP